MPLPSFTPRENLHRMLAGQSPGWLPIDVPVTPPVADLIREKTGNSDITFALGSDFEGVYPAYDLQDHPALFARAYADLGLTLPERSTIGTFGIVTTQPPREMLGQAYHFSHIEPLLASLESLDQLRRIPWPDLAEPRLFAPLREEIRRHHERGLAVIGHMACTVFEHTWYLRGMERLFFDLIEDDGIGGWLLDYFTARSEAAAAAYCDLGVDLILLGDDIGTQRGMLMAPDFWREHLKPRLARVIDAIRRRAGRAMPVAYHSDGNILPVIDDLVEIGVDILNPMQPECMPVDDIVPRYRDRLAFWGLVGTQSTMPHGSAEDVRAVVRRCRAHVEAGARILVSPTHVLEPEVPWENIVALVDEAKRPLSAAG
jgi:uroporphyrinogen decarboxylase